MYYSYYTIKSPGLVFIWDRKANEIVFAVRCTSHDKLTAEENNGFDGLFKHLHLDSQLHNPVTSNDPQVSGGMWAMGWRAGHVQGVPFGTYHAGPTGRDQWNKLRENDYQIHSLYGRRFVVWRL